MAPLVIKGNTLGEIHHKYNKIVNDAIKNKNVEITEINYDDSDFDNLFRIDIASTNRDVEYILKVLQCSDMLYVSRAIKKSPWLITDKQYAHVINPEYLFNELSPQMTTKAFNKLILRIRLLLRDEERVEDFCNYYKEKDFIIAKKWLPHCSQPFISSFLEEHSNQVSSDLMKRLCKKSITFLNIYCRCSESSYYRCKAMLYAMFYIKSDVESYLDIIEMPITKPTITGKYTKIIMTKCRDRIIDNLHIYADIVHIPTFAKFIPTEEIKDFILMNIKNKNLLSWLGNLKIKYFINRLPSDIRFEFTKKIFIDKEHEEDDSYDKSVLAGAVPYENMDIDCDLESSQNIYTWYIFAPFKTAFADLIKLIRAESNPSERIAILEVLLTTADNDMQNLHTLLKYYREHHINEPYIYKIQFIDILLSKTKTYRYDKDTWNYLKDIFTSMEVYRESDKNVQSCVRSVLLYSVINDETVPQIIDKKFEFETLKQDRKNLSQDEQTKIFNYLFNSICSTIQTNKLQNEKEFKKMFRILENVLNLLCDWDKNLKDYPIILDKIKQLIEINTENSTWNIDIRNLYNIKKKWKKVLFTESLLLSPSEDTVMNALKHHPKLIEKYKNKIVDLLKNNTNLDIFFKKISIYWSQSLAHSFKELLLHNLQQNYSRKPFTRGLCTLLPHNEITEIIKKYVPSEFKIDWSQHDEVQLCIRKYLAMNLYLVRPQPSMDMVLLYAKGDYLQYAESSFKAILNNMSTANVIKNLKTLLNLPVSLQKHAIRTAIVKLKPEDLNEILFDLWKSIKNSSIRAKIFVYYHDMLCREKNEIFIKERWELIKMFIDNLTLDEDGLIYAKLGTVTKVPKCIKGEFWLKSYVFLNFLPTKANRDGHLDLLIYQLKHEIKPFIDDDLALKIFMTFLDNKYRSNSSIRAEIFKHMHNMLCNEKNEQSIQEKWKIIKIFIANSKPEENYEIHSTLSILEEVPMSVRSEYWMKSYEFLKSSPSIPYYGHFLKNLFYSIKDAKLTLDDDYVTNIFLTLFDETYCIQKFKYKAHVAAFLLTAKTEEVQMKRYNKCLVPMFEKSFPVWDKQHQGVYHVRNNMYKIIKYLSNNFKIVMRGDMVLPIRMFTEILKALHKNIPEEENYILITINKLRLKYIIIMDKLIREEREKDKTMTKDAMVDLLDKKVTPEFAKVCVEQLKEDISNNSSSIYIHFAAAFQHVFWYFNTDWKVNKLIALEAFLEDKAFIEGYLLALECVDRFLIGEEKELEYLALRRDVLNKISGHSNKEIKFNYSVSQKW